MTGHLTMEVEDLPGIAGVEISLGHGSLASNRPLADSCSACDAGFCIFMSEGLPLSKENDAVASQVAAATTCDHTNSLPREEFCPERRRPGNPGARLRPTVATPSLGRLGVVKALRDETGRLLG